MWAGIQAPKGILHACVRNEPSSYELSVLAPIATTIFTSALRTWSTYDLKMYTHFIWGSYGRFGLEVPPGQIYCFQSQH